MTDTRFRGVFAIPPTPFDDDDHIDEPSLQNCVEFCIAAAAHGIVTPVNASESFALVNAERLRVAELVVQTVGGRVPVVIGVSGTSTAESVLYSQHAAGIGADAVIAMPPCVMHPQASEIFDFYADVARAAAPLPVWIQDFVGPIGTPMSSTLLARLLTNIPGVDYLKEETAFAPQVISEVRELAGGRVRGVMGGMGGRYLLEEYRRGACGTMPACEVADAHVRIWNALEAGDAERARHLHTQLLPLLSYEAMYSFTLYKEVLVRRGVIANARTRVPGAAVMDAESRRELDRLLGDLEPLLPLGLTWSPH